jgi:hypothetical protein
MKVPSGVRRLCLRWSLISPLQRAVLLTVGVFVLWFFMATRKDAWEYNGVDLRPKVLGARAMLAGLNPYDYDWRPGMSERLLDPWRRHPGVTRTTYPPTLLLFYAPLANVDYAKQRIIWFGAEWLAMLASTFVAARLVTGRSARVWFLAIAGFAFIGSWFFRLHVERGQYYVFVLLLLTLALVDLREGRERFRTSLLLGLAAAMRPTYALFSLLLFFARKRRVAIGALGIAACIALATLPLVGVTGWQGYFAIVQRKQGFGGALAERDWGPQIKTGDTAEGLDLVSCLPHNGANVSLFALYNELSGVPRLKPYVEALPRKPLVQRLAGLTIVVGAGLVHWATRRASRGARTAPRVDGSKSSPLLLALILIITLVTDFILAPERYSYGDVLLLPLLALLLPLWARARTLTPWFVVALFALALGTLSSGQTVTASNSGVGFWSTWFRDGGIMLAATGTVVVGLFERALRSRRRARVPRS